MVHPKFTNNVLLEIQSSVSAELRLYFLGRAALLKDSWGRSPQEERVEPAGGLREAVWELLTVENLREGRKLLWEE